MARKENHFEDFMGSGMTKSASAPTQTPSIKSDLLAKIASACGEVNLADNPAAAAADAKSGMATGMPGMPVVGQILNAGAQNPAAPAPGVVEATDALANPQIIAAGGNPQAQAVGSMPGTGTVKPVRVSDGTGEFDDGMAIVNSVTNGVPITAEKRASLLDAVDFGRCAAQGYVDEMQKVAYFQAYAESAGMLKSAGLLADYEVAGFNDSMDKTASLYAADQSDIICFQKVAGGAPELSYEDIIGAGRAFVKIAAQQDAELDAQSTKIASAIIDQAGDELQSELIKTASAPADMSVAQAQNILKAAGLLK